ncbi:Succinate-semialdehyde dehydrogenase (acetylating) [Polystyrenella longa]|uniref:Succinate-semialdehyde dehydrogenase (Acetylating) n=1 Tax=Polystyrenella longa TaxID=2528007 RepID=A0A518CI21_9PLAN|nr:aldehyde dehydrogenase family protein [Polystyrenella longa]QDU78875.1 Succinate-semialdehyde dehydrogenase (acetylating) [Polystyrenella longa]
MTQATADAIRSVVEEVLAQLGNGPVAAPSAHGAAAGNWGVFRTVDEAVVAATAAFEQLQEATMETRNKAINIVKHICDSQAEELGRLEFEETKIGKLEHKIAKLQIIKDVPGTEFLRTDAVTGDHGLTITEYAGFGVIGAITPVTHSLPTLAGNFVSMVSAGNTIVCNPHPSGAKIACEGVRRFNKAIYEATGLNNLVTIIGEPTLETAEQVFSHRGIKLLCVTGGPGVARAALASKKRAIVAGPGNPPVVVDETADIENAARSIVTGAAFDNNLLCIGEKEVFAVESIFDDLMQAVGRNGGYRLNADQVAQLTKLAFSPPKEAGGHWGLNRDFIGRDASWLAAQIGLNIPADTQIIYGETDTNNPFVPEEQMMPFIPFVRARNADHAIDLAVEFEHGFGHTAIIHSRNVRNMSKMGRRANSTLFVKNGPCSAGLGLGGEGYLSFSIATPTGEGVTNPLTFTRQRRCVMVDDLRII